MARRLNIVTVDDLLALTARDEGGCWLWTRAKNTRGYGCVVFQSKAWNTHRLVYALLHGPIAEGVEVCHTCDNPSCINPAHLFAETHAGNMRDMAAKERNTKKLTGEQVREIRALYDAGTHGPATLARMFGIAPSVMSRICRRVVRQHV